MPLSAVTLVTIFQQLFSNALCQFPISFPMPQMTGMGVPPQMAPMGPHSMAPMGSHSMAPMGPHSMAPMGPHSMAHMAPIPPLAPQQMFPSPMAMSYQMPRKMPSVVMPFYSKSANRLERKSRRKRRKLKKYEESYENDDSESGSAEHGFRRSRSKKRRQILTPVVSYVTKDGYVVYQKKIKKDKAKEWLEMSKKKESKEVFTSAEERQFQKMLKYKKKKKHHH